MKEIQIQFIPHKNQRLNDVGDWYFDEEENLIIKVSEMDDWRETCALAIHELWEALLCKHKGITDETVDDWDINNPEKGDDPRAPYAIPHRIATSQEIMFTALLGLDWTKYENQIDNLQKNL